MKPTRQKKKVWLPAMVRLFRLRLGLTQKEMGAYLGIAKEDVQALERSRGYITGEVVGQLEQMKERYREIRNQQDAKRGITIEATDSSFWIHCPASAEDFVLREFMVAVTGYAKCPGTLHLWNDEVYRPLVFELAKKKRRRIVCMDRKRTASITVEGQELFRVEEDSYPVSSWSYWERHTITKKAKAILRLRYPLKRTRPGGGIKATVITNATVKFEVLEMGRNGFAPIESQAFEVWARPYSRRRRIEDAECKTTDRASADRI